MKILAFLLFLATTPVSAAISFECLSDGEFKVPAILDGYSHSRIGDTITFALPGQDTRHIQKNNINLSPENVLLPDGKGGMLQVKTVSKKEIVIAMMMGSRVSSFSGRDCGARDFMEHVDMRQNIISWASWMSWNFPEASSAKWNPEFWDNGNLKPGKKLSEAMADMFSFPEKYAVGCYTATKALYIHAMLDLYSRIHPNQRRLNQIEKILMADGDPWNEVEPVEFATPEQEISDGHPISYTGKLLRFEKKVSSLHVIPGDWVYILNPDPLSRTHNGYEGANVIYMGRNSFNDLYNGNDHAFDFDEKIEQVYQWRNAVFNWTSDAAKIEPVDDVKRKSFYQSPAEGGLLMGQRGIVKTHPDIHESFLAKSSK